MPHFTRLAEGIDVGPLLCQLNAHPELWDQHTVRKVAPGTPHSQMTDIWVRWRRLEELNEPKDFAEPHFPVWYPSWHLLPAIQPLVYALMAQVRCVHLGGILITRIPPGARIDPHHDRGGWHAEYHNCKVYIPIKSNARCVNVCESEEIAMRAGEVWTFNNLLVHSVENNGAEERITAIISMRVE
jgi:hypothetical protein